MVNFDVKQFEQEGKKDENKGPWFGARHVQIILLLYCLVVGMATKASFAIQIVAMTKEKSNSPNPNIPTYPEWTNTGVILSSFFWTYVISNVVAAPIEKKYGPKWFLLGAIFINCVAFSLIPLVAELFGANGVLVCRMLQGMGQGFLFPTQQVILGLWAPTEERSRATVAVNAGTTIGVMISTIVPGYLSASWWGWPFSFYTIGLFGFLWCLLYLIFGHGSPATHPTITPEERRYIQRSLNQEEEKDVPVPFKDMALSYSVWAVLVAQIGIAWSNNMAYTEYPSYLDKVMGFDIQSNGLYSALPPATAMITGFIFGPLSDYLINNHLVTTVNTRRIFHLIGGLGISASIIYLSYLQPDQKLMSIVLMTAIYVSQSAMVYGNIINMIDISPRFAGIIFGISNALGQCIALFAPLLVQFVVVHQNESSEWRIVFETTSVIITGTSIIFVLFACGSRQPWDDPKQQSSDQS
ncbi:putative inorganic phosphate cotransporter [Anthonomus grandis grandis]|uniref:putative inorganic phosphate cotransporter n=1 Tax=Anthonomus grandis grandis TaxID=2921223 RepID=UPI0021652EAB|nr:putative inorganic phosphate cotransporter [Anthonomus grandis grandis]